MEYFGLDVDKILSENDAKVVWCGSSVADNGSELELADAYKHWALSWKNGFIGFDAVAGERCAKCAAAVFIHLWTHGVGAMLSEYCATALVTTYGPSDD
jgi:hypothetical protein